MENCRWAKNNLQGNLEGLQAAPVSKQVAAGRVCNCLDKIKTSRNATKQLTWVYLRLPIIHSCTSFWVKKLVNERQTFCTTDLALMVVCEFFFPLRRTKEVGNWQLGENDGETQLSGKRKRHRGRKQNQMTGKDFHYHNWGQGNIVIKKNSKRGWKEGWDNYVEARFINTTDSSVNHIFQKSFEVFEKVHNHESQEAGSRGMEERRLKKRKATTT